MGTLPQVPALFSIRNKPPVEAGRPFWARSHGTLVFRVRLRVFAFGGACHAVVGLALVRPLFLGGWRPSLVLCLVCGLAWRRPGHNREQAEATHHHQPSVESCCVGLA